MTEDFTMDAEAALTTVEGRVSRSAALAPGTDLVIDI
jgi:hypothetical protein